MKTREPVFDVMKGIGIILMLVGHVPSTDWLYHFIYSFHMPLFMFASGFIYNMTKNDDAYGAFLMKKVRRFQVLLKFPT